MHAPNDVLICRAPAAAPGGLDRGLLMPKKQAELLRLEVLVGHNGARLGAVPAGAGVYVRGEVLKEAKELACPEVPAPFVVVPVGAVVLVVA